MRAILLVLGTILFSTSSAIKQDYPIDRPSTFKGGQDALKVNTALVRVVDPLPMETLVQTLFEHSITPKKNFYNYHQKAVEGRYHMGLHSNKYLAERELKVLLQDYMPMNEADMAAAMFMFAIRDCKLKAGKEVPQDMNACQYHGARFLQDIVHRTGPIHNVLLYGMILPETDSKRKLKPVVMNVPPQWNEQIAKIVTNLGTEVASKCLEAIDPAAGVVWQNMRQSLANKPQN